MSKHEVCGDEILRHVQEALEFAAAARKFDDNNDIHDACEQYDKSVLYIDEVLIKLSTSTSQYSKLLQLRNAYDERLEFLSSYDGSKLETPQSNRSKDSTYVQRRRTHSAFKEDDRLLHYGSEEKMLHDGNEGQPKSMDKSPYAQMRVIQKSILYGAFLTPSIFIPKSVWSQVGVKFCGLTMKTSAFQAIISIVREINFIIDDRRETVIEVSATTLSSFLSELKIAHDELLVVQNQLSRPFLFIPESAHTDDSKSPSLKGQVR